MYKNTKKLPFKLNLRKAKLRFRYLKKHFGLPLVLGVVLGVATLGVGWQSGWFSRFLRTNETVANPSWQEAAQVAIAQKEYLPTLQQRPSTQTSSDIAAATEPVVHLANRAENLRAYISPEGYSLQPRQTEAKNQAWNWHTQLTGLGRADDDENQTKFSPEGASTPTFDPTQPQVAIQHPGVKEWFVNTPEGIRQNFTIEQKPTGTSDQVQLELALETSLQLLASTDTSLTFGTGTTEKLVYSDLLVTDAEGKTLPASMTAVKTASGKYTVQLAYADTNAVYPVLIDPLSTTPDTTVETNQASAAISEVANAGDLNEDTYRDVIVGVPDYDNGESNEGVAFIFYGSASGISVTPDITLEINQADASFGHSVAAVTDVNGDTFADIMVSARFYDDTEVNEGGVFIFYGNGAGISTTPDVTLQINQAGAAFGIDVAAADVNADSISDLIIGASNYDNGQTDEGAVFVFHGSGSGPSASPDVTIESNQADALLGVSVANAGDVNADTYADLVLGADHYDNGQTDEGVAFIHYGSASGVSATPDVTLEQDQATAFFGRAVAGAGDINNDTYSDVIVGAHNYDNGQTNEGAAFVYYGSGAGISTTEDVQLESNQASAGFGVSVAGAGDINFDTYADVVVGAWNYDNGETDEGAVFVYEGGSAGLPSYPSYTLDSDVAGIQFGTSVSTAGDVNADSYADIIVGANQYTNGESNEGVAYVYHGGSTAPNFVIAEVGGTTSVVESSGADDTFTVALTAAPTTDVVVLVSSSDTTSMTVDQSSLTFDSFNWSTPQTLTVTPVEDADTTSETPTVNLVIDDVNSDDAYDPVADLPVMVQVTDSEATPPSPTITTMLEANQADADFGRSVSTTLDVNADGYDDVVVGAPLYDDGEADEGVVYVYYGSASGVSTTPDATIQINQANANFGYSVAKAGDVNFDTYDDLIVGAPYYDDGEVNEGAAFIFFGSGAGISTTPDVTLQINQANANFGNAVDTAGNVNADSYQDVIVGAPGYDNGQADEGVAFVFHGSGSGVSATPDATLEVNVAGSFFGTSVATAGDVNFDTYSDVIVGAPFYANGSVDEGGAFVFHGSGSGVSTSPDTTLEINVASSYLGFSVASAGDVNNDTYADVVVGAYGYSNGQAGEGGAFVYHGSGTGVSTTADTTIEINQAGANLGAAVASAGDINNDTYDDILVSATLYSSTQQYEGAVFVHNGSASGVSGTADLTIQSNQPGAELGVSVSTAGDVNNDTYSDVIIGSRVYDSGELNEGAVFIYHGSANGLVPAPGMTVTESGGTTAVTENTTTDSFTVVLDVEPATDVVLTVVSSDTSSATVDQATLTFTNLNWNSAQTVTVSAPTDADTVSETPTITIAVDDANSDNAYDAVADEVVNVTVTDITPATPGFTVVESGGSSAATEGSTDSFTVVLDSQPTTDVYISFSNSDTTSTSYDQNYFIFTNGNWSTPQTLTLTAEQDIDLVSEVSTITLAIDDSVSDDTYDAVANQTVTFTITDNDATLVGTTVSESGGTTAITEGGATDSFSLVLTVQPATDVVFDVTSSDTTSMTVSPATLTFTNGNWSTPQNVTVTAPEDVDTTSETPTVSLAVNDASSDNAYDPLPTVAVNVAVTDNEAAAAVTPVRGTAGDLWADLVLGQDSFSEIGIYNTTNQSLWMPHGVVVDTTNPTDNKMYIYDSGNNRILGYDVEDCLALATDPLNCTPSIVIGQPGYTTSACNGDGAFQSYPTRAPATASTLCTQEEAAVSPTESESGSSMDVDSSGNLYVTDFYNHRVLKYNSPFTTDQVADQVWGQADFTGVLCNRGGSATHNTLCFEWGDSNNWTAGVDIDSSGNLWVVDSGNNRVLRFPDSGGTISSTADLVLGQPDFSSTGYGASLDQLYDPNAVRVTAAGVVLVSDSNNNRVMRYNSPTTGGAGVTFGSGFNLPHGLDFDPTEANRVWVANRGDRTVELWDITGGTLVETVGIDGDTTVLGDASGSVGVDSSGNMFIANGVGTNTNEVLVFTQGGSLTSPTYSLYADSVEGNVLSSDQLGSVYGVAVANGQLVVVDEARILFWNIPNGLADLSTGKAADGYVGTSAMNTRSDECCRELKADSASHIYTSTTQDNSPAAQRLIKIYDAPLTSGASPIVTLQYPFNLLGGGTLTDAGNNYEFSGLQPTSDGNFLWVSDRHLNRVFRIRNPLTTPEVDIVLGQVDASGTSCNQGGSVSDTTLCNPGQIAFDTAGNMYLSDHYLENEGNRRLLRFDAGTFPTDNASVIYTQVPDAITTSFAGWQPSFDLLTNYMVIGHNPYYDLVDSQLVPNGSRFPSVFYTPTTTPLDADEYLRDYFSMGLYSAFDENNNLYIGDLNRSRLLVYEAPFGAIASSPSPSPSPSNVNTGTIEFRSPIGLINNTKPSFIFRKSTNTEGGVSSYNVTLDSGKNSTLSTTGIPANGNGTANYVWKDDDRVRITYRNEQDSDPNNDEIEVYFKGLDHNQLSPGQHQWSVDIVNGSNVIVNRSVGFQVDTTPPTASGTTILSVAPFVADTAYAVDPGNRTPIFTGSISDLFVGGTVTNQNNATDTFELTNGKPNQVVLVMERLINGTNPTSPAAAYGDPVRTNSTIYNQTTDATHATASFSVQAPNALLDGWYRVTIVVKDEAGNELTLGPMYLRYDAFGTYVGPISLGGTIIDQDTTEPGDSGTDTEDSIASDSATLDATGSATADTTGKTPETERSIATAIIGGITAAITALIAVTGQILGTAWEATVAVVEPTAPFAPGAITAVAASTAFLTTAAMTMAVTTSTQTSFSWGLLLNILETLGLVTQRRPQGIAFGTREYDAVPFGLITVTRQKANPSDPDVQETVITDVNGIYRGMHLAPGTYSLALAHQNYRFPTNQGRQKYQSLRDFYRGEPFAVRTPKEAQFFAIPVDPTVLGKIKLTWRQGWRWVATHLRFSRLVVPFTIITVIATIIHPSWLNLLLCAAYLVSFAFQVKTWLTKPAVRGVVRDSSGRPISGAVVRLGNLAANELSALALTNDKGEYQLFAPKGLYQIIVSRPGYIPQGDGIVSRQVDTREKTQVVNHDMRTASIVYAELGLQA